MTDADRRRIRDALEWLEDEFPPCLPVIVRFVPLSTLYGSTRVNRGRWRIHIKRDLKLPEALDTLMHEYAHVLEWSDKPDHGHAWASAYGEIYRAWELRDQES